MPVDDPKHHEIRAAKFSIDRSPEGVTLVIEAGKLRLRFFIDGQWSDLIHQIHAGEGELGEFVPFQMKPVQLSEVHLDEDDQESDEEVISAATLGAHPVPGLSKEETAFDTPLWQGAFESLRFEVDDPDVDN